MNQIKKTIETLLAGAGEPNRKSPLKDLGLLSCASTVHIKHAPFYDPCLILVLSGCKTLFSNGQTLRCPAGSVLAVPGPMSFDLRNEPDAKTKSYAALLIPFKTELLGRLVQSHNLVHAVPRAPSGAILYGPDDALYASVQHYLTTLGNAKLLNHRLMEILLVLATRNAALLSFDRYQSLWSARVRALLSTDLTHVWTLGEVCHRLATTESTLRRNLTREGESFRALLYDLRLAAALTQLLQTSLPIYRIAYDCGYQSVSRFSANFHKRFGVPPKQFRSSANAGEQSLSA
jgi:AraC-like DNA-binding protein